ncbi:alpha-amylase family glycosyl hydrolase [Corynebacterium pelargi]|uniref:Neopullulanase n=1 Tax=Corynebacterium pelargi TaxID=1471400 RepID=A0A410W624_9CORY|nr:alpha-amylase family glycosyl hydrolase [Corynebacterium pelargi]QAU51324.1 Neopullulanase [Corynebacterium pelargi]GGG81738.1 cyclomaltodextrinase [Corynebacterium pelargi]
MAWIDHAIFWHVYPLGFAGVDIRGDQEAHPGNPGDAHPGEHAKAEGLKQLEQSLDYLISLGCNGLLLGPIFRSHTHGYDTIDHFGIDPRLGTEEDFDALAAACNEKGIALVLDGVFSHVGEGFVRPELIGEGVFEGHGDLKRLNHADPACQAYVAEVMQYWCARGVRGWRLDAAYSMENSFWTQVLPKVRQEHADVWILGEVIHGDYPAIIAESGMDSLTQYELWKAIWSGLNDANFFELEWSVRRHMEFLEHFIPNTFVGNHDVTRIASKVGQDKAVLAAVLLLTMPGIPSIYYGDELGMEGIKEERIGGDDAVRPEWQPEWVEGDEPAVLGVWKSLIALRRQHSWLVNATVETLELENEHYVYRVQQRGGQERLEVELSLSPSPRAIIRNANAEIIWQR